MLDSYAIARSFIAALDTSYDGIEGFIPLLVIKVLGLALRLLFSPI